MIETTKAWGVETRLRMLLKDQNPDSESVLLVSCKDTLDMQDVLFDGGLTSQLASEHAVKGIKGTLPTFHGFTVLWFADRTALCPLVELSSSQLIKVVQHQKEMIKILYERRQRL